jgi:uncharacterized damage-inducible protein DinB
MNDMLLRLIGHMRWADARTADATEQCPSTVPDAERLFAHIAAAEHLWYSRISGRPAELEVWPSLSVPRAREIAATHADLFRDMIAEVHESALRETVSYVNSAGKAFHNTIADIVTHLALHGERHRGQIARIIRAAGGEPPYTDYIQFARGGQ